MDPLADGQSGRLNIRVLSVGSNIIKRQHSIEESISPLKTETTAEHEDIS
jgi:7,8-dihydro-6-hydroxymethylpterin-pyrophosphokinase